MDNPSLFDRDRNQPFRLTCPDSLTPEQLISIKKGLSKISLNVRGRTVHILKTWKAFYAYVEQDRKQFEITKDDRGFMAGDSLVLIDSENFERCLAAEVIYVLPSENFPDGIQPGYVVMGIQRIAEGGTSRSLNQPL